MAVYGHLPAEQVDFFLVADFCNESGLAVVTGTRKETLRCCEFRIETVLRVCGYPSTTL